MDERRDPPQLGYGATGRRGGTPGLLARILSVAAGALVLVGAIAISIVVFAVVLAGVLLTGGYLWWKTRNVRKQMHAQMQAHAESQRVHRGEGDVIEGEVIRKDETRSPP
jgi:Flp pilus assembly protein TadB